jgi:hypothetical protein
MQFRVHVLQTSNDASVLTESYLQEYISDKHFPEVLGNMVGFYIGCAAQMNVLWNETTYMNIADNVTACNPNGSGPTGLTRQFLRQLSFNRYAEYKRFDAPIPIFIYDEGVNDCLATKEESCGFHSSVFHVDLGLPRFAYIVIRCPSRVDVLQQQIINTITNPMNTIQEWIGNGEEYEVAVGAVDLQGNVIHPRCEGRELCMQGGEHISIADITRENSCFCDLTSILPACDGTPNTWIEVYPSDFGSYNGTLLKTVAASTKRTKVHTSPTTTMESQTSGPDVSMYANACGTIMVGLFILYLAYYLIFC